MNRLNKIKVNAYFIQKYMFFLIDFTKDHLTKQINFTKKM